MAKSATTRVREPQARDPFAVEVGRRLALAREAAGYSQIQLARRLGYEVASALANWENGRHLLPPREAQRIYKAVGIDAMWLYNAEPRNLPENIFSKLFPASRRAG